MNNYIKIKALMMTITLMAMLVLAGCGNIINFTNDKKEEQFRQVEPGDIMAEIVIEGYGSVYAYIFEETTAGKNFIKLAEDGYYKGKNIDRIIKDYLIQADF